MPTEAPNLAIQTVTALAHSMMTAEYLGIWRPQPIRAQWQPALGYLSTLIRPDLTRRSIYWIAIEWRWGRLWESDNWYEDGWHPCYLYNALRRPRQLWDALNPNKAPRFG